MPRDPRSAQKPGIQTPWINWYPGHMLKAKKEFAAQLKRVDVVLELRDARIPHTSVNHDFEQMLGQKRRLVLFNKTRLADPDATKAWEARLRSEEHPHLFVDVLTNHNLKRILPLARKLMEERWGNLRKRGINPPVLKLLIAGIPNVGKSTLINRLVHRKAAETGPRPGVTKRQEWVRLERDAQLLDTPGILWPKIETMEAGFRLAVTGAIKDEVVGLDRLCDFLLRTLQAQRPEALQACYRLEASGENADPQELLAQIAQRRGCLKLGGVVDEIRAATVLLRDFREGRLGQLTFDDPDSS
ncbi:MAG: ribosome biogenesis GTPase YlqF [SAR324 cluster bacterium]|nr:ribosome biogenesis GTPase YlqF [SAR324 cluster bacterium]